MYVDMNGRKLAYSYGARNREYVLEEPNPWGVAVLGRVEWNEHPGKEHGYWFHFQHPYRDQPDKVKLEFEVIMKSPRILRCNQLSRCYP